MNLDIFCGSWFCHNVAFGHILQISAYLEIKYVHEQPIKCSTVYFHVTSPHPPKKCFAVESACFENYSLVFAILVIHYIL